MLYHFNNLNKCFNKSNSLSNNEYKYKLLKNTFFAVLLKKWQLLTNVDKIKLLAAQIATTD